jgi:FkbM family methyltransferase
MIRRRVLSRLFKSYSRISRSAIRFGYRLPRLVVQDDLRWTAIADVLRAKQIDCVLDVGANDGGFAAGLRQIGYQGWIVSFEPVASVYNALVRRFAGDRRWQGMQVACGREAGEVRLNVQQNTSLASILEPTEPLTTVGTVVAPVVRLDDVFATIVETTGAAQVMLKTDTQGFDLEVFAGAQQSLPRIPVLLAEVSVRPLYQGMPHYLEALRTYEQAGYQLMSLTEVALTAVREPVEYDCLMARV